MISAATNLFQPRIGIAAPASTPDADSPAPAFDPTPGQPAAAVATGAVAGGAVAPAALASTATLIALGTATPVATPIALPFVDAGDIADGSGRATATLPTTAGDKPGIKTGFSMPAILVVGPASTPAMEAPAATTGSTPPLRAAPATPDPRIILPLPTPGKPAPTAAVAANDDADTAATVPIVSGPRPQRDDENVTPEPIEQDAIPIATASIAPQMVTPVAVPVGRVPAIDATIPAHEGAQPRRSDADDKSEPIDQDTIPIATASIAPPMATPVAPPTGPVPAIDTTSPAIVVARPRHDDADDKPEPIDQATIPIATASIALPLAAPVTAPIGAVPAIARGALAPAIGGARPRRGDADHEQAQTGKESAVIAPAPLTLPLQPPVAVADPTVPATDSTPAATGAGKRAPDIAPAATAATPTDAPPPPTLDKLATTPHPAEAQPVATPFPTVAPQLPAASQSAAHMPIPPTPAPAPAPATPPVDAGVVSAQAGRIGQEMGVVIARHAATGGGEAITVRLDPADMGRIEVKLSFSEGGTLRAVVAAENPASLDLLRRDSADLSRALTDAGVRADQQTLRFDDRPSLGGSGGNAAGDGQPWQRRQHPRTAAAAQDYAEIAGTDPIHRPLATSGRIDMMA